eukprot:37945-Eustigmatos_ZCMA.PRE.1
MILAVSVLSTCSPLYVHTHMCRGREVGLAAVGVLIAATAHTPHAAARDFVDVRTPVAAVKTVRVA